MITLVMGILAITFLILFSAFFSGAEIAFVSVNRALIRKKARKGNKNAKIIDVLLKKPKKVINSIVLGNNIVNILASILAGFITIKYLGNIGIGIATALMTFMIVVFSEVTPKSIGIQNEKFLLSMAKPLQYITVIFSPFAISLIYISNNLTKLISKSKKKNKITEEEIRAVAELGAEEGAIEKEELELLQEALDFDDTHASELYIPREEIVSLDIESKIKDLVKASIKTGFSRFPVYRRNMNNIVGMVHVKDSLSVKDTLPLLKIKRPILKVELGIKADLLFKKMRKEKVHLAIVKSSHGRVIGLVTMEDLIEKVFGEITDEHDK